MKKSTVILFAVLFISFTCLHAQIAEGGLSYMGSNSNIFYGGIGLTTIASDAGTNTYFNVHLRPELAFGKLGVGLNVNLLFNTQTGELRKEDWDKPEAWLQQIRYIRWGRKFDPLYVKAGTLDAARLGHGSIMNYYSNAASWDNRKFGAAFDMDFGVAGFETVTNNFARSELIAGRGYVRPLKVLMPVPVLKNLSIGGTYARDFDPDASSATDDAVTVYGVDAELPLIKNSTFGLYFYYDWAQIAGYSHAEQQSRTFGTGQFAGVAADLGSILGLAEFHAKFERRWLGKEFAPAFFDAFYEVYRYHNGGSKTDQLLALTEETRGWFGELWGKILDDRIRLLGMYTFLDNRSESGILHFALDAPDVIPVLAMHATYDKAGINTVGDVFSLDNRSIARVGVGYKINPFLIMYLDYIWTFEETSPGSKEYRPQERFEPKLVLAYKF
ncbi:hypothetical protein EH223_17550 [candidate division KSB1 bacterium]|nr:hypothetical protein [candidate division KSB1 bacterium]RQW00557.1 MAG: hypothetical protein EH223_17550 [candidate division KSB1 bacterium]